jgi:hypothetical protein
MQLGLEELQRKMEMFKSNLAVMGSQLGEPPPPQLPAGPSEAKQLLQVEAQQLQKEPEDPAAQLRDNECLSHLNQEQGTWLRSGTNRMKIER